MLENVHVSSTAKNTNMVMNGEIHVKLVAVKLEWLTVQTRLIAHHM